MSYVSVQHLQKSYSSSRQAGTTVFSDINCEIQKGEFVTLLGPSGCGKSTLLRCIAGLTPVDSGKILLDDQDIVPLSPQKRNIGMVFQSYALFPNMTVEQNVAFGLRMQKVNADDSHKRVQEVLQLVELKDLAGRYPHQMSGGQCQRVALARSLVTRPRLLLLDERTIIARELHDSLAQALSYMKLQVSRLQTLMRRGENTEMLFSVSEEIREGINNAYRQLRELLTTFRLQIHGSGLDQALDDTVREFAERGAFEVLLQVEPLAFTLDASEQIHLLQIAREALSNCARHAQAKHVKVHLSQQGEHIELLIEDDGCGIGASPDPRQHHGLTIMQERTRSLNGQLDVSRNTPHGTRIHLSFQPGFLGRHAEESPA